MIFVESDHAEGNMQRFHSKGPLFPLAVAAGIPWVMLYHCACSNCRVCNARNLYENCPTSLGRPMTR